MKNIVLVVGLFSAGCAASSAPAPAVPAEDPFASLRKHESVQAQRPQRVAPVDDEDGAYPTRTLPARGRTIRLTPFGSGMQVQKDKHYHYYP
jgi:hypothetical protein